MRGAFVIRLARETSPSEGHFQGSIEEVDSGKELKFQSSDELLSFLGECFKAAFEDMTEENKALLAEDKSERKVQSNNLRVSRAASRRRSRLCDEH